MTDAYYMGLALKQAEQAFEESEIPIGAILVQNNKIIARGYNMTEKLKDVTAHAEMIALTAAFNNMGAKYLPDATLYVTIEPCVMCAGALYWSKIGTIVWGASDSKNGFGRLRSSISPFHPKTEIIKGILKEDCLKLLRSFFELKRKNCF